MIGLTLPLFATDIVAVRVPVAVGLKVKFRTQVPPAPTVLLQELACVNGRASVPVKLIAVIEILVDPELVKVRLFAVLLVLSGVFGKLKGLGLAVNDAVPPPVAVPEK